MVVCLLLDETKVGGSSCRFIKSDSTLMSRQCSSILLVQQCGILKRMSEMGNIILLTWTSSQYIHQKIGMGLSQIFCQVKLKDCRVLCIHPGYQRDDFELELLPN